MKCNYSDIEDAFHFVSSGQMYMHEAVLNKETGEVYYRSDMSGIDEFPDDADDEKYEYIPHKNELNLGRDLVFRFAAGVIPDKLDEVEGCFHKRGAYSRYKDLLDRVGKLDEWHEFEPSATETALREWCEEQGIEVD
ncbi:MAG: hypothetical protein RQ824_03825 [bacterium]|nr:hypothetical protein [bacterium]